jgi:hypothetical protein
LGVIVALFLFTLIWVKIVSEVEEKGFFLLSCFPRCETVATGIPGSLPIDPWPSSGHVHYSLSLGKSLDFGENVPRHWSCHYTLGNADGRVLYFGSARFFTFEDPSFGATALAIGCDTAHGYSWYSHETRLSALAPLQSGLVNGIALPPALERVAMRVH